MSWAVARRPLNVFFFPSTFSYFPLLRPTRVVLAILPNVTSKQYPELLFARRRFALLNSLKRRIALRQARVVVTVSEYARDGIIRYLRISPARVRVILDAPAPIFRPLASPRDPADLLPACALPAGCRYLLYVGALGVQKILPVLLEAFRRLVGRERFFGVSPDCSSATIAQTCTRAAQGQTPHVRRPARVGRASLPSWLRPR